MNQLQFRAEIVLWIILDLIPFGVLFIVMKTIYEKTPNIHSYSASDIVFYYFVVVLIQAITSTHFEGWRVEEIKNGKIDGYLLRPFSYLKEIIFRDFAGKLFSFTIFFPIYIFFYFLAQATVSFTIPTLSLTQVVLFIGFLAFGYFVELCFGLIIVLLGFWFEGSQGLEHFKWLSVSLLSGSMIPLEFLPPWLQNATLFLPFKYMYAVPINLIQGRTMPNFNDLMIISASVVILTVAISIIWKKALLAYSSSGG